VIGQQFAIPAVERGQVWGISSGKLPHQRLISGRNGLAQWFYRLAHTHFLFGVCVLLHRLPQENG
jgi:hypothetical protein